MCSSALANFFIEKSKNENIEMTNMKLQKLMFIGYGWVLAVLDKDLTDKEGFQAWQHGPVLPSIYHQMKRFGGAPLPEYATEYDSDENNVYKPLISNEEIKDILGKVWAVYKGFSAWSLRNLTHEKNAPWHQIYKYDEMFKPIPDDVVDHYYKDYISNLIKEAS